ncbi:Membrane protein involved in the export of O-antigen and teichoic acid [Enterococcus malodoratus]|uniref:lipopolysaccharide biosynthesis protein n=1 Tax=Enterococcus malodoratus TaxID=71451 RepID=UPI0008CD1FCF|nr:oligosaccharide flippase family protein [Enterococcus malodoratus]SES96442.1 Membrane protein involved in the export of O-antigen and teichoic acid [Enterococcus malodoratus]
MSQSKYKRLASNSFLFTIGNLGSKLITFFMLPLYTWKLSQSNFGISDLVMTTVSLLLPVVSLSVFDAVLRFSLDEDSDKIQIFTNSFFITLIGTAVLLVTIPIVIFFEIGYGIFIILILIAQIYQTLFSQYAKAINKIRIFAINGILLSFATAGLNVLFLVVFKLGITGYLFSIFLATMISNVWLWNVLKINRSINFKKLDRHFSGDLLKYSIPLIPNGIAFWITNTIGRYFILFFLGTSSNGLFAVANKIPSLLNVLNTIFFQAWQLSAIEEFDSTDNSKFYSRIFSFYSKFLFVGMSGILFILKPMISILVSQEFSDSWKYVPFLLLTVVYSSFSGFLGNYYVAAKSTNRVITTTIYGSIFNILGNGLLIPLVGLNGAGISSAISFFLVWIIRQKDTKRFVRTNLDIPNLVKNHIFIFSQIAGLYLLNGLGLIMWELSCLIIVLVINQEPILELIRMLSAKKTR